MIDGLAEAARWAEANRAEVASALAAVTGVPLEVQVVAANRASFLIGPVTDEMSRRSRRSPTASTSSA